MSTVTKRLILDAYDQLGVRMTAPSPEVRAELAALVEADQSRLGDVYRLTARGLTPPQIAQELGVDSSGFVSNNRSIARALLDGTMPSGPSMAKQVASSVRGLTRNVRISHEARSYLDNLLEALEEAAGGRPRWTSRQEPGDSSAPRPPAPSAGSLREQVDEDVRVRAAKLVRQIHSETTIEADDYQAISVGTFALDVIVRLVSTLSTSRTTKALHEVDRLDLSLEKAVVEWAGDLPLTTDLVESARGRLNYWRST